WMSIIRSREAAWGAMSSTGMPRDNFSVVPARRTPAPAIKRRRETALLVSIFPDSVCIVPDLFDRMGNQFHVIPAPQQYILRNPHHLLTQPVVFGTLVALQVCRDVKRFGGIHLLEVLGLKGVSQVRLVVQRRIST